MAHQYIIFDKQHDDDSCISYKVTDKLAEQIFYVRFCRKEKTIYYYHSSDFTEKPIAVLSFADPKKPMGSVPGIPQSLSNRINFQIYKAFLDNNFPEKMSHVSL